MQQGAQQGLELRTLRTLAMTTQLRQAIGLLKYSNADLRSRIEAHAARNPAIALHTEQTPPERSDPARPAPPPVPQMAGNGAAEAILAQPDSGLHAHVIRQIGMSFRDPAERGIAEAFAGALEPSGWLGRAPAEIAREVGCASARAEDVLHRLQQFEPAGLFARDLAECLRLQAQDRGLLSPEMAIVLDHLDLLARGALDALSGLTGLREAELRALVRQIRSLDPKPGAAFGDGPAPIRPPDVIVSPRGVGAWQVDLNHATTPRVTVRDPGADAFTDAAAREAALAEARWLERAVSRRHATTLKVAAAVVHRQTEFLRRGPEALRPLSFADIAAATELHESTVSRVVAGLLVATPRATYPLRDFFSTALPGRGGGTEISATAARNAIERMITEEKPDRPLSDAAIVERMRADGIRLARRTVAKYREMMGIPSSARRRARAGAGLAD